MFFYFSFFFGFYFSSLFSFYGTPEASISPDALRPGLGWPCGKSSPVYSASAGMLGSQDQSTESQQGCPGSQHRPTSPQQYGYQCISSFYILRSDWFIFSVIFVRWMLCFLFLLVIIFYTVESCMMITLHTNNLLQWVLKWPRNLYERYGL